MSAQGPREGKTYIRRGSVSIPNQTVYDGSISYAALGLLAIMLARPADAPQGYRAFLRPGAKVGQASILAAMGELARAGYRRQFLRTTSGANGKARVVTDTYISEEPLTDEQFRTWHRDATGLEPIAMPNRKKTKDTPARVSDAHNSDAHSSGAHNADAQTKAFPASSKLRGKNQEGADAPEAPEAPAQAKRAADADSPNGGGTRATRAAADASTAVDAERIHCLGCDHTFYRDELNVVGQCASCAAAFKAEREQEAAAARALAADAVDPTEVARLAAEAKQASLKRQAKRAGITVAELLAKRQPRT